MDRREVIARLKSQELALRARGVAALYLFGSYSRDEGSPASDIDVFVEADHDGFYDLSNFMGAYDDLRSVFPGKDIGYSTRGGLSDRVRRGVEKEAIRVF